MKHILILLTLAANMQVIPKSFRRKLRLSVTIINTFKRIITLMVLFGS